MVTKRKIIKYSINFLLVCLTLWFGLFLINHKIQKTETRLDFKSRWVTYHWEDGRISIGKAFGKAGASKVISVDWQSEKHLPSPSNSISQKEIHETLAVSLKAKASAKENNAILKKAFDFARKHPGTDLIFPKGHFKLGTLTPDKDYQVLPSHTSLIGRQTTLLISGSEYWLGLPSGPKAEDGVSDFRMTGLHFKAQDLVKGDKLLIMVDHGKDWFISHNRFTLVHQKGSHVFDLGSLQNSRFSENEFYGYAPDLDSQELFKKGHNLHDFYAEAIQLDAADPNGVWMRELSSPFKLIIISIIKQDFYVMASVLTIITSCLIKMKKGTLLPMGRQLVSTLLRLVRFLFVIMCLKIVLFPSFPLSNHGS
ncbi:hypothetical protein MX033_00970 [Streptococcus uberis]|uniref:hypothetical protein n=1 Tax=Streptococcus uberis TaxID=1349 RepID=UPI0027DC5C47|nr:hypothetical protein [Streptococcus uberis]MCK1240110.1 hypothetical protein [Streptococcus uberis]